MKVRAWYDQEQWMVRDGVIEMTMKAWRAPPMGLGQSLGTP